MVLELKKAIIFILSHLRFSLYWFWLKTSLTTSRNATSGKTTSRKQTQP